jgi:SAM-dependent methyltransferase
MTPGSIFQRLPALRSLAFTALDAAVRPILYPFRLSRPRSDAAVAGAIEGQTDAFNHAAETYYADHADTRQLLEKPFSEPAALSRRLIDIGVLIDSLRLKPGDVVLDLGAGTGWVSHLLNQYGCRTIAVDVSPTALALGRQMFDRDPRTRWALDPLFLPYDGHTLPVGDRSVDRVVLYDAYHHLPNPGALMREMRRVLRPDGIVFMSEPGRGHAASAPSIAEAAATGVLENELALEDIAELATASGFGAARVVIATHTPALEIDAVQLRPFMGGRGFSRYWKNLCGGLDSHHYILLFAGDAEPTTARPKQLRALSRLTGPRGSLSLARGRSHPFTLEIQNAGDTRWIAAEHAPGWTRLGAHLYRDDPARTLVDFDWLRVPLPRDVAPERNVRVRAALPAIDTPGDYLIRFDLVIEGVVWFADRGSMTFEVPCGVE